MNHESNGNDIQNEHTRDFIFHTYYVIMTKEFCHLCKEGGKKCVSINDTHEYAIIKLDLKCSSCGRPLVA